MSKYPKKLYRGLPPHVAHSDTSRAAALAQLGRATREHKRIYKHVKQAGAQGKTCDEVEEELKLRHQTASARLRELTIMGKLAIDDLKRPTRTGNPAHVYRITTLVPHPHPVVIPYTTGQLRKLLRQIHRYASKARRGKRPELMLDIILQETKEFL
jgi:hypothetical protein